MEAIELVLSREHYPLVLRQYGPEGAKKQAISMALAQYTERPLTAEMLYSCLANLESDLERMFPPPKTPEEKAEDEAEEAEAEREYQEAIAGMEPYLINGKQAMVNEMGEFPDWMSNEGNYQYPVWVDRDGDLTARVYQEGWDWLILENPERDEEDD